MTKHERSSVDAVILDAVYECGRIVDDFKLMVNAFTPGVGDKIDEDYFINRFKRNIAKTVKVLLKYEIKETDYDEGGQN